MWIVEIVASESYGGREDVGHNLGYCSSVKIRDEGYRESILNLLFDAGVDEEKRSDVGVFCLERSEVELRTHILSAVADAAAPRQ